MYLSCNNYGWLLYIKVKFTFGLAITAKLELISTDSGILRLVTIFEKKELRVCTTSLFYYFPPM